MIRIIKHVWKHVPQTAHASRLFSNRPNRRFSKKVLFGLWWQLRRIHIFYQQRLLFLGKNCGLKTSWVTNMQKTKTANKKRVKQGGIVCFFKEVAKRFFNTKKGTVLQLQGFSWNYFGDGLEVEIIQEPKRGWIFHLTTRITSEKKNSGAMLCIFWKSCHFNSVAVLVENASCILH